MIITYRREGLLPADLTAVFLEATLNLLLQFSVAIKGIEPTLIDEPVLDGLTTIGISVPHFQVGAVTGAIRRPASIASARARAAP